MNKYIKIQNARIHNLKGIDVKIPKHKLTVITGVSPQKRIDELSEEEFNIFLYGYDSYHWSKGKSNWISKLTCVKEVDCPKCKGTGHGEQASHTTIHGKTITELENMYINELLAFFNEYFDGKNPLMKEMIIKLSCMVDVGLHHLALSRKVPTLSGGEIQRLFLASYLIAEMDSIIFVFDEPTIGLHEIEKENLIKIIRKPLSI